ncbi:hypothetical protein D6D02_09906 [Aureobasidium pullulans]|uniref:Uncharacterized protein n=1 Tax=Aureobasidium pullulans TaxID=5580 RepID=A0A4S9JV80_AURPU|nr:hypothetical protein D6D29_05936 [Aureobasidium pullulans]THW07796.1 hypothetical protein D6D24_09497 [Aureobasidium pullulans]THW87636.1 hypothetical protein D6D18_07284 [Aureobasidium pullulans]THX34126.1 hypothetical protein D6D10_07651 [Aureobasidium pullulans]THX84067.1 hypothetical protein D6D04_02605 [Aureobasidium pullulans]
MSARAHSPPISTFSSQSDTAPIVSPQLDTSPTTASAKTSKRRLFGLGKKKDKAADSSSTAMDATNNATQSSPIARPANMIPLTSSPSPPNRFVAASPTRLPFALASSQSTSTLASSQIFERNVQESAVPSEMSDAIPAHIQTEDHIPAVLEASSLAITDNHLNPDQVEIVTHTAHQPASEKVAEGTASALHSDAQLPTSPQDSQHESFHSAGSHPPDADDAASNYGALDPADVRRLSFISFADVVQAEQAESKDSLHHATISASSFGHMQTHSPPMPRSPSPTRSPLSSQYSQEVTTPPLGSNPTSIKGFDMSPVRSPIGSPHHQQHGELTIETMRQALRKTASGDFTGAKIVPYPTGSTGFEDAGLERHGFR